MWLSLGGFQERCEGNERIYNTHVVVDNMGCIQATYRKIHLYDVPMVGLVESKQARGASCLTCIHVSTSNSLTSQAIAGDSVVACDSPVGRLGVTICYDMRFPELYQKLTFLHGAEVRPLIDENRYHSFFLALGDDQFYSTHRCY